MITETQPKGGSANASIPRKSSSSNSRRLPRNSQGTRDSSTASNGPPLVRRHTTQNANLRTRSGDGRNQRRSSTVSDRENVALLLSVSERDSAFGSVRRGSPSRDTAPKRDRRHTSIGSVCDGLADQTGNTLYPTSTCPAIPLLSSHKPSLHQKLSRIEQQPITIRCGGGGGGGGGGDGLSTTLHTDVSIDSTVPPWKSATEVSSTDTGITSETVRVVVSSSSRDDSTIDDTSSRRKGFVQFDPCSKTNHINVVRRGSSSEGGSIFPMMKDEVGRRSEPLDATVHSTFTEDDMPSLIAPEAAEEEEEEEEEEIKSVFGSAWNTAFTVTSDNALGHLDDTMDENDYDPSDNQSVASSQHDNHKVEEKNRFDDGDEMDTASVSSRESHRSEEEEEEHDEIEESMTEREDEDYKATATPALLQFNHKTPDGLDFAPCANDSNSIFRMDSSTTLEVPNPVTTESIELDKQLEQLDKAAGKEKRGPNRFTASLMKAASFKRPRPGSLMEKALEKAESFRIPAALLQSKDPKGHSLVKTSNNTEEADENKVRDTTPTAPKGRSANEGPKSDNAVNEDGGEVDAGMDKSNIRRRHERAKGRRASNREKIQENEGGDRKERLRKRDAVRRAASSRQLGSSQSPSASSSPKKPYSRRRRTVHGGDKQGCSLPKLESDLLGRSEQDQKRDPSQEHKESIHNSRRRSTVGKSQSAKVELPARSMPKTSASGKESLRRTSSSDGGAAGAVMRLSMSGSRRRASERLPEQKHSNGRPRRGRDDRSPKDDECKPRRRSSVERCTEKLENDRSQSGRNRRRSSVERANGKDDRNGQHRRSSLGRESGKNELDSNQRGREGNKNDLNFSQKGQQSRRGKSRERRSVDRKASRKSQLKAKENEGIEDAAEKGQENAKEKRQGGERKQKRKSSRSKELERLPDLIGPESFNNNASRQDVVRDDSVNHNSALFHSSMTVLLDGDAAEDREKKVSSLRIERSIDGSLKERGVEKSMSETFHNDLGDGDTDRRQGFMKNLSVRISAKQSSLGKGARNLIIGGSRTEKRRLLATDDDSALS